MALERSDAIVTNVGETSEDGCPSEIAHLIRNEETDNPRTVVTLAIAHKAQDPDIQAASSK